MVVNLTLRIIVKVVVVFVFLLPLALFHGGVSRFIAILVLMVGVFSIFETLRVYAFLKVRGEMLIVERAFDGRQHYALPDVEAWKENRYYLRGHLHRVLILFFRGKKVIISLYNDQTEFENLSIYLHTRHKDRKFE